MLFCSREYLFFFLAVFAVYWGMKSRWVHAVVILGLVARGAFALFREHIATSQAPDSFLNLLSGILSVGEGSKWMAGIIVVSIGLSYVVGGDRARVWLLMMSSFFFYACWNHWLALIICVSTAMDRSEERRVGKECRL